MTDGIITCDACPVLCRIRPEKTGACDRYGNFDGKLTRVDPLLVTQKAVDEAGKLVPFLEASESWDGSLINRRGAGLRHRHRRHHHLSRLQARPLHRRLRARGDRHGDRGLRGRVLLLRRQGEDRHRPLYRPRAGGGQGRRRADRPRDHGRVRLADARHRRRPPPHRRHQEGGKCHLQGDARALQQGARRDDHRRRSPADRPGRRAADHRRRQGRAHAGRLRVGRHRHLRPAMARPCRRGDRGRRPHHRRAYGAPVGQVPRHAGGRHKGARPALDARALFPGRRPRQRLGRHRHHRSAGHHRAHRLQDRLARAQAAYGLDHRGGCGLFRAGRRTQAGRGRDAGRAPGGGRPDRRELRTGALQRALHGGGGGLAARRGHGEPGAADAFGQAPRDPGDLRRRPGLCLAGAAGSR